MIFIYFFARFYNSFNRKHATDFHFNDRALDALVVGFSGIQVDK